MILEACVGNLQDALSAQSKGAHQIELCSRLDLDGNSPSLRMIEEVTSALDIPVKIIVNPKPFDYYYSSEELEGIATYVEAIERLDIAGIVFGPVDLDGMPDLEAIAFISRNTDLPITFHKAIDGYSDILVAVKSLITQNIIKHILTSGGAKTADQGTEMLLKINNLIKENDSAIQIIGAGRITDKNLAALHANLGLNYYHGKLIVGDL